MESTRRILRLLECLINCGDDFSNEMPGTWLCHGLLLHVISNLNGLTFSEIVHFYRYLTTEEELVVYYFLILLQQTANHLEPRAT